MTQELGYAVLEVGGIQNFILRTGKLKEMLGGSELVESLSKGFLEKIRKRLGLELVEAGSVRAPNGKDMLVLQANAGAMHLLFASMDEARNFVSTYCLEALESYPGLPLYAAIEPCVWEKDSIDKAKLEAGKRINMKRSTQATSTGMHTHPLCHTARLDGLPAIAFDEDRTAVSLASATKRKKELLEAARDRLRAVDSKETRDLLGIDSPIDWGKWDDNIDSIASSNGKVAFIHIDGNDLGKRFTEKLDELKDERDMSRRTGEMGKLSNLVSSVTKKAFDTALLNILHFELWRVAPTKRIPIPARPLVLGGDDVTAVVKADLALLFIHTFIRTFEQLSRAEKEPLSAGAGMVVCSSSYPFLRAYELCEELCKSAKKLTENEEPENRPSSLDYVVLTNDAENRLSDLRKHVQTTLDGKMLTGKPFTLKDCELLNFLVDGSDVLNRLPRSATRPALNECRRGMKHARAAFDQLAWNVTRGLGGRKNSGKNLMSKNRFEEIFPQKSFFRLDHQKGDHTLLADYLELTHLLPQTSRDLDEYLHLVKETPRKEGGQK